MTQERIDLTQFEGIRKDWLYQEVKDSGNSEYATVSGGEFSDILFFIDRAEISEAELKALTMVPGLIAELKRCYERLDAQKRQFSEIFELCSEYIDPRDVSEMTIQQGRILAEIWSMAMHAKDGEELPDFTASE